MKKIYILYDSENDEFTTSYMIKPLADQIGKDWRTLKDWIKKPELARKRGYRIIKAIHIKGKKGKDEE